jgi:predicted NBD/HSP70 family sugar kinase
LKKTRKNTKKQQQKNELVRLLYLHKTLTNANLVKLSGLSLPTITQLLAELSDEGYIEILGSGNSSGGRKPNLLGLTKNAFFTISVDIERYSAKIALINSQNDYVVKPFQFELNLNDKNGTVDIVTAQVQKFLESFNEAADRLIGVGISLPGLTNSDKGINYNFLNFDEVSVSSILEQRLKLPVYIINDAKARALAELRFGKAKEVKNSLVIYIGWGLGTGLILDGKLYTGSDGFSGEFSHIPVMENGILCQCGKRGCLETVASGTALSRLAKEGIARGEQTDLARLTGNDARHIHYMSVVESALKGDAFSIDILSEVGSELGRGIAMLVQILNPELIIFGGQMLKAGSFLTIPIEHSLNKYCLSDLRTSIHIDISEMGEKASLLGAAINTIERYFSNPNNYLTKQKSSL